MTITATAGIRRQLTFIGINDPSELQTADQAAGPHAAACAVRRACSADDLGPRGATHYPTCAAAPSPSAPQPGSTSSLHGTQVQRRPGNPMMLEPGRLRDLVNEALSTQGFIVCHDALPYGPRPAYGPAVCRGFYDRYDTQALQLARRLWGIVEVPPPAAAATEQPAPTSTETAEATRTAPQPPATDPSPLVFVDVDGVLNPGGSHQEALGYQPQRFDGIGPDGQTAGGIVWLHPDHGAWLAELETAGGQPVWATSWNQLANTWIAPRLGLPGTWPVVDLHGRSGVRWGHTLKLDPITAYTGHTPFVLLDDQIGGKDHDWAAQRTADGAPTLLMAIDPYTGLTCSDIDQVLRWLNRQRRDAGDASPAGGQPTIRPRLVGPCPCECNRGGFCGGCGHRGCGGRRPRS